MPVQNLKAAIGYGALKGLWPIVIVILGAIFSYNVMQATKALDILRDILASISEDKRIQVLLISWCFGGFLEAAAGYGTAVAIPIGILIALGFNPLKRRLPLSWQIQFLPHSARSGSRFLFWLNRLICRFIP
jgi:lactate permease